LSCDLLFNKRASVTSFFKWIFRDLVGVFCSFLELLCLDLLSCCVRAWFSGGGTDWLICCNPDCCW
jgi:hypothetical protein